MPSSNNCVHLLSLRVLEARPELLPICGCSHDTCVHDILLPLPCLNTPLHFKRLKLHKPEETDEDQSDGNYD